jgi:hypothetical protein
LASYDIKINHVRETENGRANALSRKPDHEEGTKPVPEAILAIRGKTIIYNYPEAQTLALMNIELTAEQKKQVIKKRHDQKTAGHQGINKTIELVTRDFQWPGMRKDVTEHIQRCDVCAKVKHSRHRQYGKLQSPAYPQEV